MVCSPHAGSAVTAGVLGASNTVRDTVERPLVTSLKSYYKARAHGTCVRIRMASCTSTEATWPSWRALLAAGMYPKTKWHAISNLLIFQ